MVDDLLFYIVLAVAIGVSALFIGLLIYVKSKMPHPLLMKVLSTLHASLFGYETAMIELIGSRGYKTHVFPKVIETINNLKGENELIQSVVDAKTSKEAMEKWLEVLRLTGISKKAQLVEKGKDTYIIEIPDCTMCNPIHEVMGDAKGICPMALIVAAASAFVSTDKVPVISYSRILPTGTSTDLKFETAKDKE